MIIQDIVFVEGVTGFFFDDQPAVKSGAQKDGFFYKGRPSTQGFDSIRMPGECVSVGIRPGNGIFAFGDCCAVQYSGAGGRDPVFRAAEYMPFLERKVKPALRGREFSGFREACKYINNMRFNDSRLHTAIRYGLSQALLAAFAVDERKTKAGVIAEEYGLPLKPGPVRIFGQSGDEPRINVDKMILKRVDVLPHGLINSIDDKFGRKGEKLKEYVSWVRNRILNFRPEATYFPELHLDVYGLAGTVFNNDIGKIADYLGGLCRKAAPFNLRIEGPLDAGSRDGQIELMKKLVGAVDKKGIPVELVADEWCNTLEDIDVFSSEKAAHMLQIKTPDLGGIDSSVEAVLLCHERNVKSYLGGTCNETEISAKICTHLAMAVRPYQLLAKPGMGFDEGFMLVKNEMQRIVSSLNGG